MNYYETLEVDINATHTDINRAYRTLSLKYQPNKNLYEDGFYERKFKEIADAYATLGDEERRLAYDIDCGFVIVEEDIIVEEKVIEPIRKVKRINPVINDNIPTGQVVIKKKESSKLVYLLAVLFVGLGIYIFNKSSVVEDNNFEEVALPVANTEGNNLNAISNDSSNLAASNELEDSSDDYLTEEEVNKIVEDIEELEERENIKSSNSPVQMEKYEDLSKSDLLKDDYDTTVEESVSSFTLGSSKNEVKKAQGKPLSVDYFDGKEIWFYGEHRVVFKNGKVVDFVDPYDQLNIR